MLVRFRVSVIMVFLFCFGTLFGQVYLDGGMMLTKIETNYYNQELYDYGVGYGVGLSYVYSLGERVDLKSGLKYAQRGVIARYDTDIYGDIYGSDLVRKDQSMLTVPLDVRMRVVGGIGVMAGLDMNIFLHTLDRDYDRAVDTNMKFGLTYGCKTCYVEGGYFFSLYPYRKEGGLEFKSNGFFMTLGYRLF